MKKLNEQLVLENIGFESRRIEHSVSLYLLGLVLMLVVALVAQTVSSISLTNAASESQAGSSRELQNSPEVGN